LIFEALNKK